MTNKKFLEKFSYLIEPQLRKYEESRAELKNRADLIKTILLKIDRNDLKNIKIEVAIMFLLNVCHSLIFFPDNDIKAKLKQLGVTSKVYRWFIPIEKLDIKLKRIEAKKIVVLRDVALSFIKLFLQSKIRIALYKDAKTIFNVKVQVPANEDPVLISNKIFRRRKYANGDALSIADPVEHIVNAMAGEFEKQFKDRKKAKVELRKQLEGKAETYYLGDVVNSFLPTKKMEQTELLFSLGDIFRLISKDRIIWNKSQYENRISSYENNFKRYVAFRVKKITAYNKERDEARQILVH